MKAFGWLLCVLTLTIALHFSLQKNSDQRARDLATQIPSRTLEQQNQTLPINNNSLNNLKEFKDFVKD